MAKILTEQHENTTRANVEAGLETRELGYTDEALKLELIFKTNAGLYRHFPSSERMVEASSNADSGAKKIGFYPTAAGMVSTNVQDAIEELETLVGAGLTGVGSANKFAFWSSASNLTYDSRVSTNGATIGLGANQRADMGLFVSQALDYLTGTTQYGIFSTLTFNTPATVAGFSIAAQFRNDDDIWTLASGGGVLILAPIFGNALAYVETVYGLKIEDQVQHDVGGEGDVYAIYTGTGLNRLGDNLNVVGSIDSTVGITTPLLTSTSVSSNAAIQALRTTNAALVPATVTTYDTIIVENPSVTADAGVGILGKVATYNVGAINFFHKSTTANLGGVNLLYGDGTNMVNGLTLDELGDITISSNAADLIFSHASTHIIKTSNGVLTVQSIGNQLNLDGGTGGSFNVAIKGNTSTITTFHTTSGMVMGIYPANFGAVTNFFLPTTAATSEGCVYYDSTRKGIRYHNGQMTLGTVLGWQPSAHPPDYHSSMVTDTSANLAASGGTRVCQILVTSQMLMQSLYIWNTDTANLRTAEWRLYRQTLNNGNAGESVLDFITGISGTFSFTPTVASFRSSDVATPATQLSPGLYWLAIRNTSATQTFGLGLVSGGTLQDVQAQTKTISDLTTTIDLNNGGWTYNTGMTLVTLAGRIFGMTTTWA